MFVRWIRWAIKRISDGPAELIGDSGWSLTRQDEDETETRLVRRK
jgi:hypothetical protein